MEGSAPPSIDNPLHELHPPPPPAPTPTPQFLQENLEPTYYNFFKNPNPL